ncbi:MAG: tetratricopeptide repeat protein, partial [Gemmatimonadetes bacterium]|nr:tetratricopeptide repeat protein [Gemmatimonadota bacterium]
FGKPAAGARPRQKLDRHWDLSRTEDLAYGTVFLLAFLAFRGVYDTVPLLFAIGLGAATTYMMWKSVRLLRDSRVGHQGAALKRDGRLRAPGVLFLASTAVLGFLAVQSGTVQISRSAAAGWDNRVALPLDQALSPERPPLSPAVAEAAARAGTHYRRADRWTEGGIGLLATPETVVRRAWIAAVEQRWDDALHHLDRAATLSPESLRIRLDRARIQGISGDADGAIAELRALVAEAPGEAVFHSELARALEDAEQLEEAVAARIVHVNLTGDPESSARLVDLLERLGRPGEAARYR